MISSGVDEGKKNSSSGRKNPEVSSTEPRLPEKKRISAIQTISGA
jgi:hypothetical protein